MSEEDKKDFVVKDRRIFSEDPPTQGQDSATSPSREPSDAVDTESDAAASDDDAGGGHTETPLPEINFSTFVMSLNGSALVHLGLIEDPSSDQKSKNLPMAKQIIDILSMLQTKTEGNLEKDEENILKNILYDLKIMYVKQKD